MNEPRGELREAVRIDQFDSSMDRPERSFERWRSPEFPGAASLMQINCRRSSFWTKRSRVSFEQMSVTSAGVSGMEFIRSPACARRDDLDGFWIEHLVEGEAGLFSSGGLSLVQNVGDILVNDLSRPSRKRTGRNRYVGLYLARGLAGRLRLDQLHARRLPAARQRLLTRYMTALANGAHDAVDARRVERTTVAVIGACALADREMTELAAPELACLALAAATNFIDDNLHREGLEMSEVVAATGVSRSTLYRLAQPLGGLSRILWRRRLDAAWTMVTDPSDRRTLLEISETVGFSQQSHFSREFKAAFNASPRDFR